MSAQSETKSSAARPGEVLLSVARGGSAQASRPIEFACDSLSTASNPGVVNFTEENSRFDPREYGYEVEVNRLLEEADKASETGHIQYRWVNHKKWLDSVKSGRTPYTVKDGVMQVRSEPLGRSGQSTAPTIAQQNYARGIEARLAPYVEDLFEDDDSPYVVQRTASDTDLKSVIGKRRVATGTESDDERERTRRAGSGW